MVKSNKPIPASAQPELSKARQSFIGEDIDEESANPKNH